MDRNPAIGIYFIAILLPEELNKKIFSFKQWMFDRWGCKVGLKSPAHITILSPFWMEEENEKSLIGDIENVGREPTSFTITTTDFSSFAARTLFIAVEENKKLKEIKRAADVFFRATDYKIKKEARPFHPHITIATRDLHKKDFWEAWQHFKDKPFKENFIATGLSLLKHNGRAWDVVYTAPFKGLERGF